MEEKTAKMCFFHFGGHIVVYLLEWHILIVYIKPAEMIAVNESTFRHAPPTTG